jgi:hypothetical protein
MSQSQGWSSSVSRSVIGDDGKIHITIPVPSGSQNRSRLASRRALQAAVGEAFKVECMSETEVDLEHASMKDQLDRILSTDSDG